jgi:diguanylate cyclase (GGDEF)-like protein
MDLVVGAEVPKLKEALKSFKDGKITELSTKGQHSEGAEIGIRMSFSSASYEGEPCTQIIIRKNSENNEALEERIKEISNQDLVTGLHNKLHFNDQLEQAYHQVLDTSKRKIVLHIGIANFVDVKNIAGVAGTDVILKQVAEQLSNHKVEKSVLARYSDDMFAAIVDSADLELVQKEMLAIQKEISDFLFDIDGKTVPVKLVCGLAHMDESCKNGNEALVQADQAYGMAIKQQQAQAYFDKSDIANLADNSVLAKVEHALDNNGMRIQFQPIMSLRGDSQEHYDILVRLKDKDGSDLSPDEFLPAIENSDLSGKLDRWVVEQSINALADHRKRGHNTQLMIHLTAASIQDPTFLPWVNSHLKNHKLPGDSICFQISENIANSYLKAAKAFSKGLSLLKCQLSVNQFGLTENGLGLTRHLDINYARIDASFVEQLINEGQASEELSELLSAIHQNDINSIVPKIENAQVLASLWELGVNYIQGYYLQAPLDDMDYNFDSDEEEAV